MMDSTSCLWELGMPVVVQIPSEKNKGTFNTYTGVVSELHDDGKVEVYVQKHGKTYLCEPSRVYPDDCWL